MGEAGEFSIDNGAGGIKDTTPQSLGPEWMKCAQSSLDAYLGILGRDSQPVSVEEMPDNIALPIGLSEHLEELTAASVGDRRERLEIVGWDSTKGDFRYGKTAVGTDEAIPRLAGISQRLKLSRFAKERPVVDFHTHHDDGGYSYFFSRPDLEDLFRVKSPAYITMVGTPEGGYALLPTNQFKRKKLLEAHDLGVEVWPLRKKGDPKPTFNEQVRILQREEVVPYVWNKNSGNAKGTGIFLQKIAA